MLTCLVRRLVVDSGTFVSGILTCTHILSVLRMSLLVMVTMRRRRSVRTIHVTCLSGSSLELTDGTWRKRVVCGVMMGVLSVNKRVMSVVVLVMRRSKGWWRVDVNDSSMALRRRVDRVVMLLVMLIMLRGLAIRRVGVGLILVLVMERRRLVVVGRHFSRTQRHGLRGRRIAHVLLGHSCLELSDVGSQGRVLLLNNVEVVLGGPIPLDVLLQLVYVLLLTQTESTLSGTVLGGALRVRELALISSLLGGCSSLGVGVGGISMGVG